MDLKYILNYKNGQKDLTVNRKISGTKAKVILFSGCKDSQSSLDLSSGSQPCGLATSSFIKILKDHDYNISIQELYDGYYSTVTSVYGKQQPVLSYGFKDDDLTRKFLEN